MCLLHLSVKSVCICTQGDSAECRAAKEGSTCNMYYLICLLNVYCMYTACTFIYLHIILKNWLKWPFVSIVCYNEPDI